MASRLARAVLGSISFALGSGYFKSCLRGFAVDASGAPVPMYTYPTIDLLIASKAYFADKTVLEFGSGQSTLWWAKYARRVVAVEFNQAFAQSMVQRLRQVKNAELIHGPEYKELVSGQFDVVSIDGYPRVEAAKFMIGKVADQGLVIVDNSDVQSLNEICALWREAGYYRMDFFGHSPAAYYKQCTSIFFKDPAFFGWSRHVRPVSPRSYSEVLV